MAEHTILVAVTVEAPTREAAERYLHGQLPEPKRVWVDGALGGVESWWIAEDDRKDGSDADSAVFVNPGSQYLAAQTLLRAGLTERHNLPRFPR